MPSKRKTDPSAPRKIRLATAVLCERVLLEKDDVVSVVRLIDTIYVHVPKDLPGNANPVVLVTALLSFKRGDEPDTATHKVTLKIQGPTGPAHDLAIPAFEFFFKPDGEIAGANLILQMNLGVKEFGRFRIDVFVDGQGPVAEMPFMLLERTEPQTPERTR